MLHNIFTFSIHHNRIRIHDFHQDESRGDLTLNMLQAILVECEVPLDGKTGFVSYMDFPPDPELLNKADLRFCTTRVAGEHAHFLPFPCPHTVAWPQIGLQDADRLMRDLLNWNEDFESDKIFWIGANTHPSRQALAKLSLIHPDEIDAEIMGWNRTDPGNLKSTARQISLWDHRHFKYLVDCPGVGYSGRLKWLLASGRPVFVVQREFVEYWQENLQPWIHFVPVEKDFSDLMENRRKLEDDPELYDTISRNAKDFARNFLLVDVQICNIANIVDAHLTHSQRDSPTFPADPVQSLAF